MDLIEPSIKYKNSFIEAVKEYQQDHTSERSNHYKNQKVEELENDFPAYLARLSLKTKGENIPTGRVPESTYWLVDESEFIGRVSMRHLLTDKLHRDGGHIGYDIRPSKRKMGYGKKILGLALQKAKKVGIENALITCDITNAASKKIIEANGGEFDNAVQMPDGKPQKLRYWIKIK